LKKIILYMASSVDGYIACPDGSVDWIDNNADLGNTDYNFDSFLVSVDTIIMGRKSYEQALSFGEWPWVNHRILVFSKSGFAPQTPNTEVIDQPDIEFFKMLKAEEGKNIWLFGGGSLNHYFLENDLIDEIMLFVQPVVLGDGIGIFGNKSINPKKLSRLESKELGDGFTLLRYQRSVS